MLIALILGMRAGSVTGKSMRPEKTLAPSGRATSLSSLPRVLKEPDTNVRDDRSCAATGQRRPPRGEVIRIRIVDARPADAVHRPEPEQLDVPCHVLGLHGLVIQQRRRQVLLVAV